MSPTAPLSLLGILRRFAPAILIVMVFCVSLPSVSLAAAGTPDTTEENDFASQIKGILKILNPDGTGKKLDVATTDMASMAVLLIKDSMLWAQKVHEALRGEANEIAATLLWAVLFAEITFTGFRLMLGSSIIEQLGYLTTKTFIYVIVSGIVVFPGAPSPYNTAEGIIRGSMFRLMHAGKYLGSELVKNASHPNVKKLNGIKQMKIDKANAVPDAVGWGGIGPTVPPTGDNLSGTDVLGRPYRQLGASGFGDAGSFGPTLGTSAGGGPSPSARAEPMMYWLAWIGVENAAMYAPDGKGQPAYPTGAELRKKLGEDEYKFSQLSLNVRIWGENPDTGQTVSQQLTKNAEEKADAYRKALADGEVGGVDGKSMVENMASGVLMGTMPLQMFGIALSVAGVQIAALITVIFAQISMLVGSIAAFNIAASLGLAVLPLMYFRTFDKIWSQYLIGLGSLALVPFLFYLLSAVGFIFSTFVFEQLFPVPASLGGSGGEKPSLALILNQMFFSAVETTMTSFGLVLSGFGSALVFLIGSMISIYITLGRIMFGCTIVAAFVSAGALFSLLAPRFAFRWQQGFGAEDVMEKIGEIFNNIQSAVGSGMGQMYADAISKGGQMGKGAMSGLSGGKI